MSIAGMHEAWGAVEANAHDLYGLASENLRAGQPLDSDAFSNALAPLLDGLLEASEQLRLQSDLALRDAEGKEFDEITTLLLAASAVDAMFARDALALDPDPGVDLSGGLLDEDVGPEQVSEEGQQLLEEVSGLFRGQPQAMGGRSPNGNREELTKEVERLTAGLVDLAEPPASELASGLLTTALGGAGEVLSAVLHLDVVTELERSAQTLKKHAPRFLRAHIMKIVTLRSESRIVDEMAREVGEQIEMQARAAGFVHGLLRLVSAQDTAVERARQRVEGAPNIEQQEGEALLAALTTLETEFQGQMLWIGRSARWLRRGARFLTHLGALAIGPLSYAIGAGVFFVGIGYVGYSLTDRLDARDLGFADRVEGVIRLVDSHIG